MVERGNSREQEIESVLRANFPGKISEISIRRPRRMFVNVDKRHLIDVMAYLRSTMEMTHVSTITGKDLGEGMEVLYHLNDGRISLSLRVTVPKSDPHLPSTCELFPGNLFYEKELESQFGFVVDGLSGGRRYPVWDEWPVDRYPLRKDWSPDGDSGRKETKGKSS